MKSSSKHKPKKSDHASYGAFSALSRSIDSTTLRKAQPDDANDDILVTPEIPGAMTSISPVDSSAPSAISKDVLLQDETLVDSILDLALSSQQQKGADMIQKTTNLSSFSDERQEAIDEYPDADSIISLASVDDDESVVSKIIEGSVLDPDLDTDLERLTTSKVEATSASRIEVPSISKIIRFAIPAMGVWLCSPLLSMIDTSAVGLLSGTAQQAALSPAVSVTDNGALVVAFMYTATTNLVASASEKDKTAGENNKNDKEHTIKTLITALQLALFVGIAFGIALGGFSQPLLRALIGNDSIDPVVFRAADRYVKIRSLGMPAAVVIGSAQSACLGMQDIRSPLYVLLAAAAVNALGDFLLVSRRHPWVGGCAGAAWATVASQYAAMAMFMAWLKFRPKSEHRERENITMTDDTRKKVDISNAILELTTKSAEGKPRRKEFKHTIKSVCNGRLGLQRWNTNSDRESKSTNATKVKPSPATKSSLPARGILANRFRTRDILKLPSRAKAIAFWPFVIPVTTTAIGRISGYVAMAHVASSALGTIDMAAQAIIMSCFCCLTPVCESLNLTAQSFVPAIYGKKLSRARADALRQTFRNFMKVSALFGGVLVAMVSSIPILSQYFTSDLAVRSAVRLATPALSLFFALSGLMCIGEGMLLGQKDLKFLRNAYAAYFFAVPYFLLRLKRRALAGLQTVGVGTMWETFSIYQLIRVIIWLARMRKLQERTDCQVS